MITKHHSSMLSLSRSPYRLPVVTRLLALRKLPGPSLPTGRSWRATRSRVRRAQRAQAARYLRGKVNDLWARLHIDVSFSQIWLELHFLPDLAGTGVGSGVGVPCSNSPWLCVLCLLWIQDTAGTAGRTHHGCPQWLAA